MIGPMRLNKPFFLLTSVILLLWSALCLDCWSASSQSSDQFSPNEAILPAGTIIPVILQEPVSTETAVVGQPISALIAQDIFLGARKVLSASDRIWGTVQVVDPPFKGKNAILKLRFDLLTTTDGHQIPLTTQVMGDENRTYWGGESTPGTQARTIPYHVYQMGTYGRTIYVGERAMGEHVKLDLGTRVVLVLQAPVRLVAF